MSTARTATPELKPEQAGTRAHTRQSRLSPALRCITNPDIVECRSEDLPRKWGESGTAVRRGVVRSMTTQK
jgi:hypothetical protein